MKEDYTIEELDDIYLALNAECVSLSKKFNIYDPTLKEDNNYYFQKYMELSRLMSKVYYHKKSLED